MTTSYESMPVDTYCSACDTRYTASPSEPWRCDCGAPLNFVNPPVPSGESPAGTEFDLREGLWAFADVLPVERHVSLGEGMTPLIETPAWNVAVKLEYVSPTGSFKDRGATTTLSRALSLGVDHVLEDSSGNAGAAIATYAARAGLTAEIFVPASVKAKKLRAIERTGAEVVRVEGSRAAVTEACIERVEAGDGWYASHAWNPAFYAGTSTMALEICVQRDWRPPDVLVCPVGHGTLFLGAYHGFKQLYSADWIDSMPRLLGAQAAGFAPIATELHGQTSTHNTLADGIQITSPVRRDEIFTAVTETAGDVIAIDETATAAALDRLHQAGFYCEPTSAIALAALEAYRDRGVLDETADVVVPLTGSGLKSE